MRVMIMKIKLWRMHQILFTILTKQLIVFFDNVLGTRDRKIIILGRSRLNKLDLEHYDVFLGESIIFI